MTHDKILAMLAGHDAQHPMAFDDLVKKSGLLPATLNMILLDMYNSISKPINYATITKKGKTQTVYWPTGVVNVRTGPQGIVINPRSPHSMGFVGRDIPSHMHLAPSKVKPNTAKVQLTTSTIQENTMSTPIGGKGGPSQLNLTINRLIEATPGITHQVLVKKVLHSFPAETQTHIQKTLSNMQHVTKKIIGVGKLGDRAYWLKDKAPAEASSPVEKKKALNPDDLENAALRRALETKATHPAAGEESEYYGLNLNDEGCLFISVGEIDLRLNAAQTQRLHRFMGRLSL
jgi:hypothetical protein